MLPFFNEHAGIDGRSGRAERNQQEREKQNGFMPGLMVGGRAQGNRGGVDWLKMLRMMPRAGRPAQAKSQRPKALGQKMDVARTRMQGLYGVLGIPPWGG